jgi:uncharacterized membrane protein
MHKFEKPILWVIFSVIGINMLLLLIRNAIEANKAYNFLIFNLFLAFLPFLIAYGCWMVFQRLSKFSFVLFSLIWLLFYPNAPYMMSDLIHVQAKSATVIYDTLIIFSFASLALFLGFYSLNITYKLWIIKFNVQIARVWLVSSIFLSSLGIYLGRILRLNSWDFFTRPIEVLEETWFHLWPINHNAITYYIVALFTIIQFLILLLGLKLGDSRLFPLAKPENKD